MNRRELPRRCKDMPLCLVASLCEVSQATSDDPSVVERSQTHFVSLAPRPIFPKSWIQIGFKSNSKDLCRMGNKKRSKFNPPASKCCQCGELRHCKQTIPGKGPACAPCRSAHYRTQGGNVRADVLAVATLASAVEAAGAGGGVMDMQVMSHFARILLSCEF